VDLARAQGRPTISLGAGPSWQNSAGVITQGGSVGVSLNVPLFTGFDTTYRVRSASAQAEVRAAQRDRIRNQIALDVWKAYQSLTTATQSLKTTADLVASAEQSERVALGRYKAGVGTVLDLLSAQSALASARLQRIQAQLDWNVYRATLAQTMGALDYTLLQPAAEGRP
jgi:outer membrane protein TolC